MDPSLISAALGSIKAAKDLATAAIAVRDWNLVAVELAKLNDQLLSAQEALFTHNSQLLEVQQELMAAKEKLRLAEAALAERGKYYLSETAVGSWAYRHREPEGDVPQGQKARPHFLCQPCFDSGKKSVLQVGSGLAGTVLWCTLCKSSYGIGLVEKELLQR